MFVFCHDEEFLRIGREKVSLYQGERREKKMARIKSGDVLFDLWNEMLRGVFDFFGGSFFRISDTKTVGNALRCIRFGKRFSNSEHQDSSGGNT